MIISCLPACNLKKEQSEKQAKEKMQYSYTVNRSDSSIPEINAVWDKDYWNQTPAIELNNFMGDRPAHFPHTEVKLRYDDQHIYVIFKVSDRYVKAVEKEINGKVWQDSRVEFFFSPGPDTERGYFNLETNCKGVFLFGYHLDNRQENGFVKEEDYSQIQIAHSLTRNVEEEITGPVEWTIEYAIPVAILSKYMKVETPGPGTKWRANFYKCADETSHPHWLTWARVEFDRPRFHLPEFFGTIEFE